MNPPEMKPCDTRQLELYANPNDLQQDLLAYLDYISVRSVKRSFRDNNLSKADFKELALRFSAPDLLDEIKETGSSGWIEFVDFFAWMMRLVSYEANDHFGDFFSRAPTSSENFVVLNDRQARQFLALSGLEQEAAMRQALTGFSLTEYNELYDPSPLGKLDHFGMWERSSSSAQQMTFQEARQHLLSLLALLESGVWYSVADLVQHLKQTAPYFLLPRNLKPVKRHPPDQGRYAGFNESRFSGQWGSGEIAQDAPDAFERVEGRFIERFFEGLPLLLRYVELAYARDPYTGPYPARGLVRAFKINDRFKHLMRGVTPPAQVTVQPNYEVIVVSEVYPSEVMREIGPLAELISNSVGQSGPGVHTLRLIRERVASAVARDPSCDPVSVLARYSKQGLSQNVIAELREWAAASEIFTLYDGFALLEGTELPRNLASFVAVQPAENLRLVRNPELVFKELERAGAVPLRVSHGGQALSGLPDGAQTHFSTPSHPIVHAAPEIKTQSVTLKREVKVILRLGQKDAFEALKAALIELNCPLESDEARLTLQFPLEYDPLLETAIQRISSRFEIKP